MATHPQLVVAYHQKYPHTCYGLGEWRRFAVGVWEVVPELAIRREIQRLAITTDASVTNGLITSVLEMLKAENFVRDQLFDADPNILVFNDCVLQLDSCQTREHSLTDYATTKLPFNYDPTATSDAWTAFLESTVPEYAAFLQEYAGYCLTTTTRYELAVWLWGPPGGGKSTFIEGLRAMLGPRSCLLGLNEVERSSFALSQLPGKTLAISTEQPSHFVKSPHLINAIISGEPIQVDRKFRDAITVVPRAKLVWGMNELPRVDGSGVGIFRRIIPVHFPAIPPDQRDPAIKEAVLTSGMAIANWALAGLARLAERGKFEIPDALMEAQETYRVNNDVPQMFLMECCTMAEGARVKFTELYAVYQSWAKRNGHGVQSSTAFAAEMRRLGIDDHRYNEGKCWCGIQLLANTPLDLTQYDDLITLAGAAEN